MFPSFYTLSIIYQRCYHFTSETYGKCHLLFKFEW